MNKRLPPIHQMAELLSQGLTVREAASVMGIGLSSGKRLFTAIRRRLGEQAA